MLLSRKIQVKPNEKQIAAFRQHCGVARHAYNWGLGECIKVLELRKKEKVETGKATTKLPSAIDLHKRLVSEVKKENPWYYECSKCAPQQSLRDLESAFKRMIKVKGSGFPNFKKRSGKRSFYLNSDRVWKQGFKRLKLPNIGWVNLTESIPENTQIKTCRLTEKAGRWFVSFRFEKTVEQTTATDTVGVDLGVKMLATLSTAKTFEMPRVYKHVRKLKRLQRKLSRQKKGSERRNKTKQLISVIHYRICCKRQDATHKLTHDLAKNHGVIVIEDLCVSGMMSNHHLAASVQHANFGEIRRQLAYKTLLYGSQLVVADRFFPSSQICSRCGGKQKLKLSQRQYECPVCGNSLDRDLNAARNLAASFVVTARDNPEVSARQLAVPGSIREESSV